MSEAPIVIVAPCPLGRDALEGWMSRIRSVDGIFAGQRRIYLDFTSPADPGLPVAIEHGDGASEYRLDMTAPSHRQLVEGLILASRFVYVHTVHLARFLLPYYLTGKIVTDVHGIVPEEERMLGRPEHGAFYEAVECAVALNSRLLVVVTEAMRDHLLAKYPECRAEFLVMPIIERHDVDLEARRPRAPGERHRVVYAGGVQAWQNIDASIAACAPVADLCEVAFLSGEHEYIARRVREMGVTLQASFGAVDKAGLAQAYLRSDFGFVLRDPVAVNTVSCPTKLSEYMWFGVVPVVKAVQIGDFDRLGYAYLTVEDFKAGMFPDADGLRDMQAANRAIIDRLSTRFKGAAEKLAGLSLENRIPSGSLAGLPVGQAHLIFPNQAEVYLFANEMQHRVRALAGPYDVLEVDFRPSRPASIVRIVPLLADLRFRFRRIRIAGEGPAPAGVSINCPGAVEQAADGTPTFTLPKSSSYIDIGLTAEMTVSQVTVEIAIDAVGPDATPRAGAAGTGAGASLPVDFSMAGQDVRRVAPIRVKA